MFQERLKKTGKILFYYLVAVIASVIVTALFVGLVYAIISFATDYIYSGEKIIVFAVLGFFCTIMIYLFITVLLKVWQLINWLFLEPYKNWQESKEE